MYDFVIPRKARIAAASVILCLMLLTTATRSLAQTTLRIGHFPNITHVQALIAHHMSRQGKGWFEQRLGPNIKIEWYLYNAGPSATEAIFAKSIDMTYVGPNPAINAYVRSGGKEIRIVAGSVNGGSALMCTRARRSRRPLIFAAKKSPHRNSAIPKMWRRVPGSLLVA